MILIRSLLMSQPVAYFDSMMVESEARLRHRRSSGKNENVAFGVAS